MRARALPCTVAHARQDGSPVAAAHPSSGSMTQSSPDSSIARALAYAFLAGEWEPAAMGRRGKQALADRRKWLVELANVVRAGFPDKPVDRPNELAAFIAATDVFRRPLANPGR